MVELDRRVGGRRGQRSSNLKSHSTFGPDDSAATNTNTKGDDASTGRKFVEKVGSVHTIAEQSTH